MQPTKNTEPIPGYTIKERIGVGGYGEVWSAQAPGDLAKAIKFVYGHFDDERAARELKALHRIREVRHPFLLSLERFEVIDGQLLIVTELADMSLKDRFDRAKADGLDHIPREELLGYLRDAADALDYMNENFSLQHLDVKPENLLLVGGRVKVADFGLVKQLHDVTASLMGGLTPVYASPEVFDGRPSQRSDQYSLAIVYQEMLTSVLPFPGRTAAQLASQHLHASPRLTALPAKDQPIIARALSKDSNKRFGSCRALVDALLSADRAGATPLETKVNGRPGSTSETTPIRSPKAETDTLWKQTSGRPHDGPPIGASDVKTQVIDSQAALALASDEADTTVLPQAAPIEPVVDLPPLDLKGIAAEFQPTLFVGIGGAAGRILRKLRRRLGDRFGGLSRIPAMQMLLLDTDSKSLYQMTQGDADTALKDVETLSLPLRNAHDYTSDSRNILQWLSRRWLYNIPRSLQTEGRRPLGRLALVDHAPAVLERVRKALAEITASEALEASAAATGQAVLKQGPRVVVISSISGGTGGGMVLDVAHAVRKVLAELQLPEDGLCGLLIHSTDRNPATGDLALANAYACLSELYHYDGASRYPGDTACGLPSAEPGEHTFAQAYLVHLGHGLSDDQFDSGTDALASYLYLSTVSGAAGAFEQCRQSTCTDGPLTLRTFGLACIGGSHTALPELATGLLTKEVLGQWCGERKEVDTVPAKQSLIDMATEHQAVPCQAGTSDVERLAADHARQTGLEREKLSREVTALVEKELGGNAEAILAKLRDRVLQRQDDIARGSGYLARMLHAIGSLFGASSDDDEVSSQAASSLLLAMEGNLKELAAPQGAAVRAWILDLIEKPGARIGAASQAGQWYAVHLRSIEHALAESLDVVKQRIQATEHALWTLEQATRARRRVFSRRKATKPSKEKDAALLRVIRLRIEESALHGLCKFVRLVTAQVSLAGDQLKDFKRELGRLSQGLVGDSVGGPAQEIASCRVIEEVRSRVTAALGRRISALAERVDQSFQSQYLEAQGGLRHACQNVQSLRSALLPALRAEARAEVMRALKEESIVEPLLAIDSQADGQAGRLQACVEAARPRLTDCGGTQRLLAIMPQNAMGSALEEKLLADVSPPPTVVTDSDADLVLCYEVGEMAIPHVVARLIGDRGDVVQIAGRLHTRSDVSWSKVPDVTKCAEAVCATS